MKKFFLALALLVAATAARAVYLNPEGHGQALIFPYYTVQPASPGEFNTYLTIRNRAVETKALRVRLRESRNGREVASFNLFLAPSDMWTAAIIPGPDGGTWITTVDGSCVDPPFASQSFFPDRLALSPSAYTGANADGYGEDAARLREGFVEVLEMASITASFPAAGCAALRGNASIAGLSAPSGSVSGSATLINVADGTDFSVPAEALADLASRPYFRLPADPYPDWNIAEVDPAAGLVTNGRLYRFVTTSGLAAVEAVLMRTRLENDIILDEPIAAATDWIVTFPTKRLHPQPSAPFEGAAFFPGSRDVPFGVQFASREGAALNLVINCGFLCPFNTFETPLRLRSAANVISFRTGQAAGAAGTSHVFGSPNAWIVTLPTTARNGQASVVLGSGAPRLILSAALAIRIVDGLGIQGASLGTTLTGLPAVGFMARNFRNGTLNCGNALCQGNYGGAFPHGYSLMLTP